MNLCVEFIKQTVPEQLNMEKEGKAMESECRKGKVEMELKIVRCSQMFQGIPPLYESGTKGPDLIIDSFISTMEKDGWSLKGQDGMCYIFTKTSR